VKSTKRNHSVDFLFLMVVFLLFTFSAVSVLLLAVNSYKAILNNGDQDASSRAAVAYVREVVHQNDKAGNIALETIEGQKVLVLDQGDGYVMMIYALDGKLRELYTTENSGVKLSQGADIMDVVDFDIDMKDSVITVDCTDDFDNHETVIISVKSKEVANESTEE